MAGGSLVLKIGGRLASKKGGLKIGEGGRFAPKTGGRWEVVPQNRIEMGGWDPGHTPFHTQCMFI